MPRPGLPVLTLPEPLLDDAFAAAAAGWPELMRLGERLAFPLPGRSKTVGDRNPHAPHQLPNRRSVGIGTQRGWSGPPTVPTVSFTEDQL